MTAAPRVLGSSGLKVAAVSYGAMTLTWAPQNQPDETAFETLNAAIEGVTDKVMVNAGTFYTTSDTMDNLLLLGRYFEKYPQNKDKVVLSVKGGFRPFNAIGQSSNTVDDYREELKLAQQALKGKTIDIFQPARRNPKLSNEQIGAILKGLRDEGHFSHVGLSEVKAETIRGIHAVVPVTAVELEYSPFTLDIERLGILDTCRELGIAVVAYSPVGRGFFTGALRSREQIPAGDVRLRSPRFSAEKFGENLKLVDRVTQVAERVGVKPTQLVMAWELAQYDRLIVIPGSTRAANVRENREAEKIQLDKQTIQELRTLFDEIEAKVSGNRYKDEAMTMVLG